MAALRRATHSGFSFASVSAGTYNVVEDDIGVVTKHSKGTA
jgi:hypothetical protein